MAQDFFNPIDAFKSGEGAVMKKKRQLVKYIANKQARVGKNAPVRGTRQYPKG